MKNSILIRSVSCHLVLQCIIKTRHKCIHSADINAFILKFLNIHNAYIPWVLICDFNIKVLFAGTLWYPSETILVCVNTSRNKTMSQWHEYIIRFTEHHLAVMQSSAAGKIRPMFAIDHISFIHKNALYSEIICPYNFNHV